MEKPLVSVLMVNYNKADLIGQSIESVLQQSYSNIQFLILDDGSTDESCEVIEKYARQDSRIEPYYYNENRHICAVTNEGLKKIRGQYVARIDSDDLWTSDKLERQLEFMLQKEDCRICFTGADVIDENGNNINKDDSEFFELLNMAQMTREENLRFFFIHGNYLFHSSVLMTKELVQELGDYNLAYCQIHDFDYWVRAVRKCELYKMDERLGAIRRFQHERERNNSSQEQGATVRYNNEFMFLRKHFFADMDNKLFKDAFQIMFRYPDASTEAELACEKAFLLCGGFKLAGMYQPLLGLMELEKIFAVPEIAETLKTRYNYVPKTYYGEMGNHLFVDQYVKAKLDSLEVVSDTLDEVLEQNQTLKSEIQFVNKEKKAVLETNRKLQEENDDLRISKQNITDSLNEIANSSAWKLTAPIRKILDKVKK